MFEFKTSITNKDKVQLPFLFDIEKCLQKLEFNIR